MKELVYHSNLPEKRKANYKELFGGIETKSRRYIAHLVREKYQKQEFVKAINNLGPGHTISVRDNMKQKLLQKFR